jgi:hypothetical protein
MNFGDLFYWRETMTYFLTFSAGFSLGALFMSAFHYCCQQGKKDTSQ